MKIYISADIKGVAGVVTEQQGHSSGFEYGRARRWMSNNVETVIKDIKACKPNTPITLGVSFKHYRPVELLAYLSQLERLVARHIRFIANDMIAISRFLVFILSHDSTLQP